MPQSLEENPTFIIRPVPTLLPEGSEIIRRKSKAERQSLMVEESTELGLPAGGWLPGRLLYRAGWGWAGLASFYLEGHPGEKDFFKVRKKSPWAIPCYFLFSKSWEKKGLSQGRAGSETRCHVFLYNFRCKLIEKWQRKCQCCFSFFF